MFRAFVQIFRKILKYLSALIIMTGVLGIFDYFGWLNPILKYLDAQKIFIAGTSLTFLSIVKFFVLSIFLLWIAIRVSRKIDQNLDKHAYMQPSVQILVSKISKMALLSFALFLGMSFVGIDISVFAFFVGALGVALGLGIQNICSNLFSGFLLLLDRSVKPGDVISIEEGKTYGVVHKLNARYVTLRTRNGKEHLIPNEYFITKRFENWSYSDPNVRIAVNFTVSVQTDLEKLEKILILIAEKTKRVLDHPKPQVRFLKMYANSIDLELRVWIKDPQNGTSGVQSEIIKQAKIAFEENQVEIPYPASYVVLDALEKRLKPLDKMKISE